MPTASFTITQALKNDTEAIYTLMSQAIKILQAPYLSPAQIEASSLSMGLDSQLIEDGTYYCVWAQNRLVGCGGWSRRATLYGGNHSAGRDSRLLDPHHERARIRAMYTHPDYVHQGIGRLILNHAEIMARQAGFQAMEMAATMAGKPFYLKCGYHVEREWLDRQGNVPVPLATMSKSLT